MPTYTEVVIAYLIVFLLGLLALRAWTDAPEIRGKAGWRLGLLGFAAVLVAFALESAVLVPLDLRRRFSHIAYKVWIVGTVEELVKALPLFVAVRKQVAATARVLVAQAFLVAMTLAVVESIGHATPPVETTWSIVAARSVLSIPGHMGELGCLALLVAEYGVRKARGWLVGFAVAAALHSVYDWAGLVPQLFEPRFPLDWPFRMVQVAIVYGTFGWLLRRTKQQPPDPITT